MKKILKLCLLSMTCLKIYSMQGTESTPLLDVTVPAADHVAIPITINPMNDRLDRLIQEMRETKNAIVTESRESKTRYCWNSLNRSLQFLFFMSSLTIISVLIKNLN